jgi:hypothetical protein
MNADTTRRSILAAFPALAVAVPPAVALPPPKVDDPIFAAIEAYKREDERLMNWYLDESTEEVAQACGAHDRATPVGKIVPTTVGGAAALLALYCDGDPWENGHTVWGQHAVRNVLVALNQLAAEGASK